jgi:hypothetical protein
MERYKQHPTYTNYEVSNLGNIRNIKTNRILKQRCQSKGYSQVNLQLNKVQHTELTHALVAEAWLGERPNGNQIDHIDRNRENNVVDNLRYVTPYENMNNRLLVKGLPHIIKTNRDDIFYVNGIKINGIEKALEHFIKNI